MSYCKSYWYALAALAGLLVAAPQAAKEAYGAPKTTVTKRVFRPGETTPYFVAGTLTAASQKAPEAIAEKYLASGPSIIAGVDAEQLVVQRVVSLKRGHLVRFEQRYQGLLVLGGETAVRIDDAGRVRWAASGAKAMPEGFSLKPKVSARAALDAVAVASGYSATWAQTLPVARATHLFIYASPGTAPRLAYQVRLPNDLWRMEAVRAYVDAESGRILIRENLVQHQDAGPEDAGTPELPSCPTGDYLAYMYEENPVETEDFLCKPLEDYLTSGDTLTNARVAVLNCIDDKKCRYFNIPGLGSAWVHFCTLKPVATANAGDFTDYWFVSDTEPEDEFAEVQMFYHVNKVHAVARSLGGFTGIAGEPIEAWVNLRTPPMDMGSICEGEDYTGTGQLEPFNNAAFMPADGVFPSIPETNSIVFGQGSTADFSYDGDVIYHEFGHAVMNTVSPNLQFNFIDEYGLNPTPGGLHEGYADLMTMFVTDDPEVGEYAGPGLTGGTEVRDMDNIATCPAYLVGQSHADSLPFTGAVWEARTTVATTAEQKTDFDEALFAAQQGLGAFDGFQTVAAKIVAEVQLAFDESTANTVQGIFDSRGLNGCNNRVVDGSAPKPLLSVSGTDAVQGASPVPGPVQHSYDLPVDAVSFEISILASQAGGTGGIMGGDTDPNLKFVVKGGGDEILWTQTGADVTGDYTHEGTVTIEAGGLRPGSGTIEGGFPAGTYHLQIVNLGPTWVVQQTSFSHTAGDITPDAGPTPDADPGVDNGDDGGCGCVVAPKNEQRVSGSTRGGIVLVLFGLFALTLARRRRRD